MANVTLKNGAVISWVQGPGTYSSDTSYEVGAWWETNKPNRVWINLSNPPFGDDTSSNANDIVGWRSADMVLELMVQLADLEYPLLKRK